MHMDVLTHGWILLYKFSKAAPEDSYSSSTESILAVTEWQQMLYSEKLKKIDSA